MANLLLIENDYKLIRTLKNRLEKEDFIVDFAKDGRKGLSKAAPYKYDVIILDLSLPEGDSLEICRQIREKEITAPILALVDEDSPLKKIKALNEGCDDCLVNPFDINELVARLGALLRRKQLITSEELKIDNLVVDTMRREARRGARRIYLNAKEYKILTYFLEHRNRIVRRQEIKNHVWGKRARMGSNTIDVHIRYLRRKINKDGKEKELIHTIRGEGYKLVE